MNSDWLASRVQASPQKRALLIGDRQWRYAELDQMVNGMCHRLVAAGVQPGQMVGALLPNGRIYITLIHALVRMGAVLVPLNTRLTSTELTWQIEHVNCKLILTSPETADQLSTVNCQQSTVNEDWLQRQDAFTLPQPSFALENLQAVVFTSGTSGKPKAVPLTFNNHFYSAMGSAYRLGTRPSDLWLSCLPLYHVGGLAVIFRSCLYGTAVDLHPKFDLDAINNSLGSKPITLISLVPTMLHRLLQTRDHWPATLRLILLGGAAASPDLIKQANALPRQSLIPNPQSPISTSLTPIVATTYGLTETASQTATLLPAEVIEKPGSVGRPLLFTQVKIVDDNGKELSAGERGEIVVSGPTVMAGYIANGELQVASQTSTRNTEHGLRNTDYEIRNTINTGDIGYLDEDGDLWVLQRRADLIVSGGENVYPAEVEAALKGHKAVANVCVVGVPNAEWGQTVAALVMLVEETAVTPADLIQYCRTQLAGYKIPRQIQFTKTLPQTASGKIARSQVAEWFHSEKNHYNHP
ncbi:MAG: o-succinylbenzoate--CoA ligase [Chloroflexi bacterium]|nr:o-succinylbenzoate--CoA ligase [Chloroflexota bacterium]